MNTSVIPPWVFEPKCPECGAKLDIKRDSERKGIELQPQERLFCAIHGDQMSLEEARRLAFKTNRDDIIDKAREFARDSVGKAIKDAFRR